MSFLDKAKDALNDAKNKVDELADEHGDKMKDGVDKAADFVDEKTEGKYSDRIDAVQEKAKETITEMDDTAPAPESPENGEQPDTDQEKPPAE